MSRDFFYTNPAVIDLVTDGSVHCLYSWSVASGETMHFAGNVSTSYGNAITEFAIYVYKDGQEVATSWTDDWFEGSTTHNNISASVFYNERVSQDAVFELCYWTFYQQQILVNHLQYQYQIFGKGHNWGA